LESKLKLNSITLTDTSSGSLSSEIEKVLQPLGGLGKYISKGDQVLLKPNFNTADPFPASTDPDFLLTVAKMIMDITPNLKIIESSMLRLKTVDVIKKMMGESINDLGIPLITEDDYNYKDIDLQSLGAEYVKKVKLPQQILDPEVKLVLLPCLKTHFIAQYTGALKIAVGFMEKKQRVKLHMSRTVPERAAELNLGYKPHLIIMDARKIFVTKGPTDGQVEMPQRIIVGTSRTEVDSEGVSIIQSYNADNMLKDGARTVKHALKLGIE